MAIGKGPHPLERLTWSERLRWSHDRRRTLRAVDAFQLDILRGVADDGAEVYSVVVAGPLDARRAGSPGPGPAGLRPVEVTVGERRFAGRVSAQAQVRMEAALRSGGLRLVGAGRYGRYWTFGFECLETRGRAAEVLVVLADQVVLLPGAGGAATDRRVPALQRGG